MQMLIKKYEPTLLWNANNGSHGSCLPSQNCSGGWTSDFWKRSPLVSGHHSQLPLITFWCKRQNYERISGWDPVFGKWCHSNSNQKGDSRLWTVWAGRNGNRSPTGTVIFFFPTICMCESRLDCLLATKTQNGALTKLWSGKPYNHTSSLLPS